MNVSFLYVKKTQSLEQWHDKLEVDEDFVIRLRIEE
jgi:hypothetical protein